MPWPRSQLPTDPELFKDPGRTQSFLTELNKQLDDISRDLAITNQHRMKYGPFGQRSTGSASMTLNTWVNVNSALLHGIDRLPATPAYAHGLLRYSFAGSGTVIDVRLWNSTMNQAVMTWYGVTAGNVVAETEKLGTWPEKSTDSFTIDAMMVANPGGGPVTFTETEFQILAWS